MRPRPASLAGPLVASVLATGALAGCGSSSQGNGVAAKTPAEIVAGAKILADAASSVHVSGAILSGGSPISFDMYLVASRGARGQVSESGLSFEVIRVHETVFIKGSPAFYNHVGGPAAAQVLQGRWLKASARSGSLASLGPLTDLRRLIDAALTAHGTLVKGATTTVSGRKVLGLTDTSTGGRLYVSTTGAPYPVEIATGGAGAGAIAFDHWNAVISVLSPPPVNTLDISQLQSGH
jgi:hypothetical protein